MVTVFGDNVEYCKIDNNMDRGGRNRRFAVKMCFNFNRVYIGFLLIIL